MFLYDMICHEDKARQGNVVDSHWYAPVRRFVSSIVETFMSAKFLCVMRAGYQRRCLHTLR